MSMDKVWRLAHERHLRALAAILDRLTEEDGPLDTPEDEAEIQRYMELMRGFAPDDASTAA